MILLTALTLSAPPNLSTALSPASINQILAINAVLIVTAWFIGLFTALLLAIHALLFRRPGRAWNRRLLPPISVLIPARNEEASIEAALIAVLKSRGVDIEVIVLDDASTDRTAEIVQAIAEQDVRVRLETAPPLPAGWNGKQYACWHLASLATRDVFCFLDADMRLDTEALYRLASELNYEERKKTEMSLVSAFPRQVTRSIFGHLLLPLIHFVRLGYLPLIGERLTRWSIFAAGCGQVMIVRREPYFATGGHSAIPLTLHDGLKLPRLFRRHGFRTRVFDLSRDAACVYNSAGEVWRCLSNNATEGIASWLRLPVLSLLLFAGQVLPVLSLIVAVLLHNKQQIPAAIIVLFLVYAVRCFVTWRYRGSWSGAVLHPLGVLVLLLLQWSALLARLVSRRTVWKQREYRLG